MRKKIIVLVPIGNSYGGTTALLLNANSWRQVFATRNSDQFLL